MNENSNLKSWFESLQNNMIAAASDSEVVDHPTDMGDISEKNWIQLFKKYLPKRYKTAKAIIFDSQGNKSDQIDLVLYDAQYSYMAFNRKGILYIPAESVYAVFEIKQTLNRKHMKYAGDKARSVRKLHRTSAAIPHAGGVYPPKPLHRIIAGILTTRVGEDWSVPFGDPFKRCLNEYNAKQQIDCGCVLKAGSFSFDYDSEILKTSTKEESLVYFFPVIIIASENRNSSRHRFERIYESVGHFRRITDD